MIRQMTDEEVANIDRELDEFWKNLDWNTKTSIMRLMEPFIEQANCDHEWIDPNEYENELDKTQLFCRKCHIQKPLWYGEENTER